MPIVDGSPEFAGEEHGSGLPRESGRGLP
jgi:hypothetical protein